MPDLAVWILSGNAILLLGLAYAGWRKRETMSARWFGALQFGAFVWIVLTLIGLKLPVGRLRIRVWGLGVAAGILTAILWLGFILVYTGRDRWLEPKRFGPIVTPLVLLAMLYAAVPTWEPLSAELEQSQIMAGTVVQTGLSPLGGFFGVYIYAVFLVGLGLVVVSVLDGEYVFIGQSLALVAGTAVTVVASAVQILWDVPVQGYPLTQVSLGVQSLFWGYAVFRQEFLRAVPGIARIGERTVFEDLNDGFLIANNTGLIVRANARTRELVGRPVVGEDLDSVLDDLGHCQSTALPCQFERARRTYHATTSDVFNRQGETIGQAVIIRDVTELVSHQQRLQVLNRILRHNVRNDVTVIRGAAEAISHQTEGEPAMLGERIVTRAENLERISQKAGDINHNTARDRSLDRCDPGTVLEEILDSMRARYPAATVSVSVDAPAISTDRELLTRTLTEVIENALDHGGQQPTVTISVTARDEAVEFVVADDGPGIPESELEPLRTGEETALQHTSSLGLWLLYWEARTLGGSIDFRNTDDGATVTLTIPAGPDGERERATATVWPDAT